PPSGITGEASGKLTPSRTLSFSNYDKGTNVDGFYVFKTFFEDVLYLPGIRFQVNNPGLVSIDGAENDYTIRYTYTYRNSLPMERQGTMVQTSGKGKGFRMALHTRYSYYPEKA
ncbi:MAG TPA: hypothetical protein VHK91_07570, partial [Flavisolibacter sp.]|nr:hypothetical protein [Flavisolibacter sp.]